MKKILLLAAFVFFAFSGMAQMQIAEDVNLEKSSNKNLVLSKSNVVANTYNGAMKRGKKEHWFNFALSYASENGAKGPYIENIFIDSIMYKFYSQKDATFKSYRTRFHSVGVGFQPCSDIFELSLGSQNNLHKWQPYNLDSIAIPYVYVKHDTNVVDTLLIDVYRADNKNFAALTYAGDSTKPAGSVAFFDKKNVRGRGADHSYKVPLTMKDTAEMFLRNFIIPLTSLKKFEKNVGAVGFTITFKSGKTYNIDDTTALKKDYLLGNMSSRQNSFFVRYVYDDAQPQNFYDLNTSLFIHSHFVKGGLNIYDSLAPALSPVYYLSKRFASPRYISSYFKVNWDDSWNPPISVKDISKDVSIKLFPNPSTTGEFKVGVASEKEVNLSIEIFDIRGKKVKDVVNNSHLNSGYTYIPVSTSDMQAGVYMVKVSGDKSSVTYRVVVK